ncbi:MAG: dTMP kinase [Leptolyngbya sp.]|nr:dTMP kinase [Candidatus Melainabacteria bacterium]
MATTYKGSFITLEGPEGAGKTTQLKLLSRQLDQIGCKHIVTRDPGGTSLGKQIRRILLNPENPVMPMTELLLYQADRAQHVDELIRPALDAGTLVLCDRYIHSTIAYQGYARGIDFDLIDKLNQMATGGLMPEITILFDIDSSAGLGRLHPGGHDRLEREAIEFHHKVRKGYNELAKRDPEKWAVIDASKPLSVVQEELRGILVDNFSQKHKLAGLLE